MSEANPRLFASHVAIAHGLLRFTLGVALLMHGVVRVRNGIVPFANGMADRFAAAGSLLPGAWVRSFGLAVPPVELALGFLLVVGLVSLPALICTGLWIAALVFGACTIQDWQTVAVQLGYAVVVFLLIVGQPFDQWSADSIIRGLRPVKL